MGSCSEEKSESGSSVSPNSVFSSSLVEAVCNSTSTLQLQAAVASASFAEDSFNGTVRPCDAGENNLKNAVAVCRPRRRSLAGVPGAATCAWHCWWEELA